MKKYNSVIQRSMGLCWCGTILIVGVFIAMAVGRRMDAAWMTESSDAARGVLAGLLSVVSVGIARIIARNLQALRNPEVLKQRFIQETDERLMLIRQQSGEAAFNIILTGLLLGVTVSCFIDETIFAVLLAVLVFVAATRVGMKLYYKRKWG